MQSIKSLDEGLINIGASDTITRHFLIESIKTFHSEYPRVKISIHNRPSPRSVEKLISGELDLAVINVMPHHDYGTLVLHPIATLEHIFISRYPLNQKKKISLYLNFLSNLSFVLKGTPQPDGYWKIFIKHMGLSLIQHLNLVLLM